MNGRLTRRGDHAVMGPGDVRLLSSLRWENKDFDPLPVRVSIAVEDAGSTPKVWPVNSYVILRARLSWGNDGGGGEFIIDVRRGCVVCLSPCQSMQVEVEYLRAPSPFVDGPPLNVSASAVYGDAPPQQALLTHYVGDLSAPAESTPRLRIPAFADRATLLGHDSETRAASGMYLRLYRDNNAGEMIASYDLGERQEAIVPQGAEWYTVFLKSPGVRQKINATWLILS